MEADNEDIHHHCLNCVKVSKCTVLPKPGISCGIVTCEFECGAKFHSCKNREHKILCPNEKVQCINAGSGCPSMMLRKHQSKHLYSCPASVIHCTAEWNRWPIHVHDKKVLQNHSYLQAQQNGHLDVALAMRDQRMLHRWCAAAREGWTSSINNFRISPTNCSWIFKKRQSSRESNRSSNIAPDMNDSTPWEIAPPGLEQSVCNELCRTCCRSHDTLTTASSSLQSCTGKIPCGGMVQVNCHCDKPNNAELLDTSTKNETTEFCFCRNHHNNENGELECTPNYNLEDVLKLSDFDSMIVYDQSPCEGSVGFSCNFNPKDARILTSSCVHPQNPSTQISYFKFRNPSSTPPWCLPLGLDLNLESRTLYQTSNFMYTFLCCQEFRRDEYAWHYINVHCEIHSGLNGWLQERCPLAQYGCMFARKRFSPAPQKSTIVYNEILDSFGVAPTLSAQNNSPNLNCKNGAHNRSSIFLKDIPQEEICEDLNLTHLPFEVLQHITRFLDSFSLSNLSLTCSLLRVVCASLLEERGLVVLKWEREKKNDRYTWNVAYKRWFFSSHFSPVHQWCFEDSNNMSNHLKSCIYFNRTVHRHPFSYVQKAEFNYNSPIDADEPMRRAFENATTKL